MRTCAKTPGRTVPQLSRSDSMAHMLTLIVPVLTASLRGQWFWLEWGWVTVLGQGSLFSSLSPFPTPTPPLYPPAHPSILFRPFGQLSLNPANHRLGWSVGNQTGFAHNWLRRFTTTIAICEKACIYFVNGNNYCTWVFSDHCPSSSQGLALACPWETGFILDSAQ